MLRPINPELGRRFRIASAVVAASILLAWAAATGAQTGPVERLGWMAGCWELRVGDRVVEEQWMAPKGGSMLGMSRTVAGERLAGFEQLLIREDSAGVLLRAIPSGQTETEFRGIELTDSSAIFENPAHDFPQRVIYRSVAGGDSLRARVEGTLGGVSRGSDFPYGRVPCAGSD